MSKEAKRENEDAVEEAKAARSEPEDRVPSESSVSKETSVEEAATAEETATEEKTDGGAQIVCVVGGACEDATKESKTEDVVTTEITAVEPEQPEKTSDGEAKAEEIVTGESCKSIAAAVTSDLDVVAT